VSLVLRVVLTALFTRPSARIRYGSEHRDQRAEVWLPKTDGPHLVAVVLHGGWWRANWRRTLLSTRPIARDLARNGYATYNVEYRRVGDGGGWPQTFDDVLAAIDAVGDVDLVVGHSAGGHLALYAAAERPVKAVVALAAPSDLEADDEPAVTELMGGTAAEHPDRYAAANPIRRVPLGKPTLLVHGTRDDVVPLARSRDYAGAAGAEATLVEPACDHRAVIDPRHEAWRAVVGWLEVSREGVEAAP
jgi:acetyl esterase/lipase